MIQAANTKTMTGSMAGVVKSLDAALTNMDLEKVSSLMDKFERQFENPDVQSSDMEEDESQATEKTTSQDAVEQLMKQTADELGLELSL